MLGLSLRSLQDQKARTTAEADNGGPQVMVSRGSRGFLGIAYQPDDSVGSAGGPDGNRLSVGIIKLPTESTKCWLGAYPQWNKLDGFKKKLEEAKTSGDQKAVKVAQQKLAYAERVQKGIQAETEKEGAAECKFRWIPPSATGGVNQYPYMVRDRKPLGFVNLAHVGAGGEEGTRYLLGWADPLIMNDQAGFNPSNYKVVEVDENANMYGEVHTLEGAGWGNRDQWTTMEASGCIAIPYGWPGDDGPGQVYSHGAQSGSDARMSDVMRISVVCPDAERGDRLYTYTPPTPTAAPVTVPTATPTMPDWWSQEGQCAVSGTMYGPYMSGKEYSATAYPHDSESGLYIFITQTPGAYKMTGVSLSDARRSSSPASPVDKYVRTGDTLTLNSGLVTQLWDGTLDGYRTEKGSGFGYQVKDVVAKCGEGEHM